MLSGIPKDILYNQIAYRLPIDTIRALSSVSKEIGTLYHDSEFWKIKTYWDAPQ